MEKKQTVSTYWLLAVLMPLSGLAYFATDIYVPAFPEIAKDFNTDSNNIQLSIASFILSLSIFQLLYGLLSDRYGRKIVILYGLTVSIAGSMFCLLCTTYQTLIYARALQGVGLAVCLSVVRAIPSDLFTGKKLAKFNSIISAGIAAPLLFAPLIGGIISEYTSWRYIFSFLLCYTVIVMVLFKAKIPETNLELNKNSFNESFEQYWQLLFDKRFMAPTLCYCVTNAGIMAYVTTSPFLLQVSCGLSPREFGLWWMFMTLSGLFSSSFNHYLINFVSFYQSMLIAAFIIIISGIILILTAIFDIINPFVIVIPTIIYLLGMLITHINSYSIMIAPFQKQIGVCSSLYGAFGSFGATMGAYLVSRLPDQNQLPIGSIFFCTGIICWLISYFLMNRKL